MCWRVVPGRCLSHLPSFREAHQGAMPLSHARLAALVEEGGEVKFMGLGGRADADTHGMSPGLPVQRQQVI
jgi:hypothetical protein